MLGRHQRCWGKIINRYHRYLVRPWNCSNPVQKRVGTLPKDTASGPFADEWKRVFGDISKEVEEVDIAPALSSAAFSVKGPEELVSRLVSVFWS